MHVCFVIKNIHDKTGQIALSLCNEFIKAGHHVHFAFFDLDEEGAKTLPKSCSYAFIEGYPSIFSILPNSKLRNWIHYIKFWNATEVLFCFDKRHANIVQFCTKLEHLKKPVICVTKPLDIAHSQKYLHFISNMPKDIIHFPDNSKILLIEFGGVGDVAQRFADIKLFKLINPTIKVWLCVQPKHANFAKMQPCVDGVIEGFKKPIRILYNTILQIRSQHFDYVTDISHNGGHSFALIFFTHIPNKFQRERLQYKENIVIPVTDEEKNNAKKLLSSLSKNKIFICAGAGAKIKMYPAKYWITLLNGLEKDGWNFVFCGNGSIEKEMVKEITETLPDNSYVNLIDKTNLPEIAGIASQCTIALGNETGLLHIAALAGIPTLGIFSQPVGWQAGFQMPWYSEVTAVREIGRFNWNKPDTDYLLDRLQPQTVREKFDTLVKKCGIR